MQQSGLGPSVTLVCQKRQGSGGQLGTEIRLQLASNVRGDYPFSSGGGT
jgi:hypothetical protein